jgi:hypothetical protein
MDASANVFKIWRMMLGRVVSHESNGAKVTIIRNDRREPASSLACALRQAVINPVDGNCVFPDWQWSALDRVAAIREQALSPIRFKQFRGGEPAREESISLDK